MGAPFGPAACLVPIRGIANNGLTLSESSATGRLIDLTPTISRRESSPRLNRRIVGSTDLVRQWSACSTQTLKQVCRPCDLPAHAPHRFRSSVSGPAMVDAGLAGLLVTLRGGTFGQVIDALQQALQGSVDSHLCNLPKVVVIGSESVGKSSLLENLTKLKLFPSGDGLKTRCPIVLNLHPSIDKEGPIYDVSKAGNKPLPETTDIDVALQRIQAFMPPEGTIDADPIEVNVTAVRLIALVHVCASFATSILCNGNIYLTQLARQCILPTVSHTYCTKH